MIHPSVKIGSHCVISDEVIIGEGTEIKSFVEIRSGAVIGKNCYIDSGVKISGDCVIGDNVTLRYDTIIARGCVIGDRSYFAPKCMTNNLDQGQNKIGGAKVGKGCFFGTATVLHHGISIADNTITGVHSFVNSDILEPKGIYFGCPAKRKG
jgi:UDP-N-acetylglucosamine acyltransferase